MDILYRYPMQVGIFLTFIFTNSDILKYDYMIRLFLACEIGNNKTISNREPLYTTDFPEVTEMIYLRMIA